jgi:ketosteroid isomerase-like protein
MFAPVRELGSVLSNLRVSRHARRVALLGLACATLCAAPALAQRRPPRPEMYSLLHPEESTAVDTLAAAERSFSALSVAEGMREAFLGYLSDSGVIFRPLPVNGKRVWQANPKSAGTLIWEPEYAEVSESGELGYTTGPWEFRSPPERRRPTSYGHFCSVWRREPVGWRVALDLGVSHTKPARGLGQESFHRNTSLHVTAPRTRPRRTHTELTGLDNAFTRATESKGIAPALADMGAADLRFNTEGAQPASGVAEARSLADTLAGSFRFLTRGAGLAKSDDLGYTYGVAERIPRKDAAPADSSVYLHVWRRGPDRHWKLALAVWNPLR